MILYYAIIWTVFIKLQNHFDKLALAHMDEEQRTIKLESERNKIMVLSKMRTYYIVGVSAYFIVMVMLPAVYIIPKLMNNIVSLVYGGILNMPYWIKTSKLTNEANQQIEELYTDENEKKEYKKFIFVWKGIFAIAFLASILILFLV